MQFVLRKLIDQQVEFTFEIEELSQHVKYMQIIHEAEQQVLDIGFVILSISIEGTIASFASTLRIKAIQLRKEVKE